MKIVKGDLVKMAQNGDFDVIIHGCNCFHCMGAGVALQIAKAFPDALHVDKTCTKFGDIDKLGTYTAGYTHTGLLVFNAYTQFSTGKHCGLSYKAIRECFKDISQDLKKHSPEFKIGYPKIGAGLGGGDWNIISKIIDEELKGLDHTLVLYKRV